MGKAPDMLKLAGFVDARKRGIKIQIWFFRSLGSCASQRHTNRKDRNCPWLETSRLRQCTRSVHNCCCNTMPMKEIQKHSSKPSSISYTRLTNQASPLKCNAIAPLEPRLPELQMHLSFLFKFNSSASVPATVLLYH